MLFEENYPFHPQVGGLEDHSSSNSEIYRPVRVTSLGFVQNFEVFVSFCDQLWTKILRMVIFSIFWTIFPQQVYCVARIAPSDGFFDVMNHMFVEIFSKMVIQLSKSDFLVNAELALKLLPVIESNSLSSIRLKNFDVVLSKLYDHRHMIIFAVCDQSLKCTGSISGLHE